jgi:glycosyltransferase involved in cell wall biosynthesis
VGVPRGPGEGVNITVAIPAHNEANRYLAEVLGQWRGVAGRIVVVDDCSTDGTADLARSFGAEVYRTPEPLFSREWRLRSMVWELAAYVFPVPDWVVLVDADELLDPPPAVVCRYLRSLADARDCLVAAPLFDLWDARETYRDDCLWTAHRRLWPFAHHYHPGCAYRFRQADHHVGRWPERHPPYGLCVRFDDVRILHLGWLREEDRRAKHERYMRLDPEGRWGSLEQYRSILDPNPRLSRLEPPPCAF